MTEVMGMDQGAQCKYDLMVKKKKAKPNQSKN